MHKLVKKLNFICFTLAAISCILIFIAGVLCGGLELCVNMAGLILTNLK